MKQGLSPIINRRKKLIEFHIVNPCAHRITVAGSFNKWARDQFPLQKSDDGMWKITIPLLPHGKYQYKFFIDEHMQMEDIENPYREPDGITGFNSLLQV